MSKSTLTLVTLFFIFVAFAALGSSAEAVNPAIPVISQMQVPITGATFYNLRADTSCDQIVSVTGTLNIVTVAEFHTTPANPTPMVYVLANLAGLTGTGYTLGFQGYGKVQYPPSPCEPSLDLTADFSLVPTGVLSPGSPDFPPSPCIGMASDFPVNISLTFDEEGNLTGATAGPQGF